MPVQFSYFCMCFFARFFVCFFILFVFYQLPTHFAADD